MTAHPLLLPKIRLILGTTYRDVHPEREYLLKRTLPQIKRCCEEQGVDCTYRELKWAGEPAMIHRQMNRFLEALSDPDTYYIGLNYGIRPPASKFDTDSLIASSVSNQLAGLLERNASWREIEEQLANQHLGRERVILLQAASDVEPPARQLLPEEIGVLLVRTIESILAKSHRLSAVGNSEQAYHHLYLASRAGGALQVASCAEDLLRRISKDQCVVLFGAPGSGKSTSVALAMQALRANGELVIPYVLDGADSSGESISRYVRSCLGEREPGGPDPKSGLSLSLSRAGELMLALDGVEHLDQNSHFLGWLPDPLPKNVRVIASTSDERQATALEAKGWSLIRVPPLEAPHISALIDHLCWERDLALTADQRSLIAQHPLSFHPQFILTLIEELGQFGWFAQLNKNLDEYLDEMSIYQLFNSAKAGALADTSLPNTFVLSARLQYYLQTHSIVELYQKVLERLEFDFGAPQLTRILGYLGIASRGLALEDLASLSGLHSSSIQHILNALGAGILTREGRIRIGNEHFSRAIEKRYLNSQSARSAVRSSLVHFLRKEDRADHTLELALQYALSDDKQPLRQLLLSPRSLDHLLTSLQNDEIAGLWKRLDVDVDQEYLGSLGSYLAIEPTEARVKHLRAVADLLLHLAKPAAAHTILLAAIDATDGESELVVVRAQLLRSLGRTLYSLALYRDSEAAYRSSIDLFSKLDLSYETQLLATRKDLAQLLAEGARYPEADALFNELVKNIEQRYGSDSPELASTLYSIGLMLNGQGKYDAAINVATRARSIFIHHWGVDYPELGWCYFVFATAYRQKNELDEAANWYAQAIMKFVQMHGEEHPIPLRSIYGLAVLLQRKGDLTGAVEQARKVITLRTKLLGGKHADTAAAKVLLGGMLKAQGEYAEARSLLSEGLEVFDAGANKEHPEVARTLHELGEVYSKLQLHEKAKEALTRAAAIRSKVLGCEHPDAKATLALLATLETSAGGDLVVPVDQTATEPT